VINITTGESAKYTIMANLKGNLAFWPDVRDPFANNLFRIEVKDKDNVLPSHGAGVITQMIRDKTRPRAN
jgi:hypothetical protein